MSQDPFHTLRHHGRSVLVISNWQFEANNSTERVAKALARAGVRTRYAARPQAPWRSPQARCWEEPGLETIQPWFLGVRLTNQPFVGRLQSRWIARQLGRGLEGTRTTPVCVYHDPWKFGAERVVQDLKEEGWRMVHLHLDHGDHLAAAELADLVLSVVPAETEILRRSIKAPVLTLPQLYDEEPLRRLDAECSAAQRLLAEIPRPRLMYSGAALQRLDMDLINALLEQEPGWSFVTFGKPPPGVRARNWHVLPWQPPARLAAIVAEAEVGFLPYRVSDPVQFHCVPLKLWDFLAADRPAVLTPIAIAPAFGDLVRVGSTVAELRTAIADSLAERPDPERQRQRIELAGKHSVERLRNWLAAVVLGFSVEEAP